MSWAELLAASGRVCSSARAYASNTASSSRLTLATHAAVVVCRLARVCQLSSDFGVEMPRSSDESRPGDGHSSGALDDSLGWRGARAWGSQDENDDGDSNHPAIEALRV